MKAEFSNIQVLYDEIEVRYEVNGERHVAEIQEAQDGSFYFIHYFEDGSHKVVNLDLKEIDEKEYYSKLEFKAGDL